MLPEKNRYSYYEILEIFELSNNKDVPDINRDFNSLKEAETCLNKFKKIVKKQYRKLAIKYHPDTGGDGQSFRVLNNLYKSVMDINIVHQQPIPTIIIRTQQRYSSTTTSSTYYTYY